MNKNERYQKYDLNQTLVKFARDEPFYGYISRYVRKEISTKIPTACATFINDYFLVKINEEYILNLAMPERLGLLTHEMLHITGGHVTERGRVFAKDKQTAKVWNYATDLAINCLIDKDRLPEGALIPGVWKRIEGNDYPPEILEAHQKLGDIIRKLPKDKSSEWYYKKLLPHKDLIDKAPGGSGDDDGGGSGTMDDHSQWTDGDEQAAQDIMEKILKEAIEHAEVTGWGSVPQKEIVKLRKRFQKTIRWEDLLRIFVGRARTRDRSTSIKKINKRYPYIHPGPKRKIQARIAICVDQSGSMKNIWLEKFFAEISNLSNL
jgi:predicted metal-dependent peptidase